MGLGRVDASVDLMYARESCFQGCFLPTYVVYLPTIRHVHCTYAHLYERDAFRCCFDYPESEIICSAIMTILDLGQERTVYHAAM